MTNEEAIKIIEVVKAECEWNAPLDYQEALDMATSALGAIDQYRWERDIAIEQLKELGYALGEKIRTDGDCISRQAAIDAILAVTGNSSVRELYEHVQEHGLSEMWSGGVNAAIDTIIAVPSAQPEIIRCKDCKWWSNDDYRECSSPNYDDGYVTPAGFYCGYAERRTDEDD